MKVTIQVPHREKKPDECVCGWVEGGAERKREERVCASDLPTLR